MNAFENACARACVCVHACVCSRVLLLVVVLLLLVVVVGAPICVLLFHLDAKLFDGGSHLCAFLLHATQTGLFLVCLGL